MAQNPRMRQTGKINILLLLVLAFTLTGCRLRRPDDVLAPKYMEQFLYDFHLAQSIAQDLPRAERYKSNAYTDWAYEKNGISKEQFNRSLVWYTRYPKELAKIYKRLQLRVDEEYYVASRSLAKIEKQAFKIESGDSVDLWYNGRNSILNTSVYMNKLVYSIKNDTTFHNGDTVRLGLDGLFVRPTGNEQYAYMSISAYYGDSVSTADTILTSSGPVRLELVLDNIKSLNSISGSINYQDSTDNREGLLVMTNMELMRYHAHGTPADSIIK